MDSNLMDATRAGNINELYKIISSKPDILGEELLVETPLHVAASAGQTHFALEILRLKPSFGKKLNPEGLSPLHLALQNKHYETVKRLVKFDSELIRVKGKEGLTPLHFVAKTDDQVDLLSEFLHVCPLSINDVTIHEETALHTAVKSSSLKAVEALLEWLRKTYKGEVLCLTDEGGNTVLHTAVSTSQLKACFYLFFGSINIIVVDGLLALNSMIVKLLVKEIYTDTNAKNLEGHTALEIAAKLPDGPAKTDIEKTLGRAGALKKSSAVSDLGEFLKSPRQWFQALIGRIINARREMSMDMRNMILVIAVLIATATFQALLQPPGGVMRNNNAPSPPSNTTHICINGTITTVNFISTNITHFNDNIFTNNTDTDTNTDTTDNPIEIMLTKSMTYESFFINFFTLNTVCFLASITAMIVVLPMRLSSFMLHIPLLFLIVSYGIAFYSISPNPSYANAKLVEHGPVEGEEDHGSSRVGKPQQLFSAESTQPMEGGSDQCSDQFKNKARCMLTRGDGSVIGADWRSDTVVADSCSIVGKELEAQACKEKVAGYKAFNAPKPTVSGNDSHVFSAGCKNRLSEAILRSDGLDVEVGLDQNYFTHVDLGLSKVNWELGGQLDDEVDLGGQPNTIVDLGLNNFNLVDLGLSKLYPHLGGQSDGRTVAQPEIVSPSLVVDESAEEISSSEEDGRVAHPCAPVSVMINNGPTGRFWQRKGQPRAPVSKSGWKTSLVADGTSVKGSGAGACLVWSRVNSVVNEQPCDEQVCTLGFMRSLSESSRVKARLNLEVVLTTVDPSALLNQKGAGINRRPQKGKGKIKSHSRGEVFRLRNFLAAAPAPSPAQADCPVWNASSSGLFTVLSTYSGVMASAGPSVRVHPCVAVLLFFLLLSFLSVLVPLGLVSLQTFPSPFIGVFSSFLDLMSSTGVEYCIRVTDLGRGDNL
ncbi:Ankyrin repeat-containing protein BDA1 [Camellia lanceoleosa]|nr:Ankyrin repeat-containing protein BDA1 [Camellia lanceoleosa]